MGIGIKPFSPLKKEVAPRMSVSMWQIRRTGSWFISWLDVEGKILPIVCCYTGNYCREITGNV